MPGTGHGSIPEGVTIQEVMRAGPSPCSNGELAGASVQEEDDSGGTKCLECGSTSKSARVCAGCWQAWYCSRAHQVKGWPKHKHKCHPFKITQNETVGRFLIATRDIKGGELLLEEDSIIIGPKQITEPVCLACYRPVDGSYTCSDCGFPMCNSECQSAETHQPECKAVLNSGQGVRVTLFGEINSLYECITPLRILGLKTTNPATWDKFMSLESHADQRGQTEAAAITQRTVVDIIIDRLHIRDFDSELIQRVLGVLDTNAFEIRLPDSSIQGVYQEGAMLEHSCIPNTHRTFDGDLQLVIRAAVDIKRGDHLTNCYTDSLTTTQLRQEHLLLSKYFTCNCPRCIDPTEFQTYLSALICPECRKTDVKSKGTKKGKGKSKSTQNQATTSSSGNNDSTTPYGVVVASDPISPSSPWVCQTCSAPVDTDYAVRMTAVMSEEAEELESGSPTLSACEAFLHKWSSMFHEHHAVFMNIKYIMIHLYGSEDGYSHEELAPIHLIRKEELCRELLEIADKITPGISRLRGSVHYELYQALFYKTISLFQTGVTGSEIAKKIAQEAYDSLLECSRVLTYEPPVQPEGQLGLEAKNELSQMAKWISEEGWKL